MTIAKPYFPWVGGKEKLIPFVRSVFPPNVSEYTEPFGGSGAVLLDMPRKSGRLDIYNDYNSDLSNLFICVKDCSNQLLRELKFLPIHSRAVFEHYRDFAAHKKIYIDNVQAELRVLKDRKSFTEEQADELRPIFEERIELYNVRRAAAYYNRIRGSFSGTTTSFGAKSYEVEHFLYLIPAASQRLQGVIIENQNGIDLIKKRNREDGLIYADPPYYQAEKSYTAPFNEADHIRLHAAFSSYVGYAVLSYNDCPFIRSLYKDFYILGFKRKNSMAKKKGSLYGELIITNYDPTPYMAAQLTMFDPEENSFELELQHIPTEDFRRKNIENRHNEKQRKQNQHPDVVDDVQQSGQPGSGTVHPAQCHAASAETDDSVGTDSGVGVGSGGGQSPPDEPKSGVR